LFSTLHPSKGLPNVLIDRAKLIDISLSSDHKAVPNAIEGFGRSPELDFGGQFVARFDSGEVFPVGFTPLKACDTGFVDSEEGSEIKASNAFAVPTFGREGIRLREPFVHRSLWLIFFQDRRRDTFATLDFSNVLDGEPR
jgi:hypothetical protein